MNSSQRKEYKKRVNALLNPPVQKKFITLKEITGFDAGELWQMGFREQCKKIEQKILKK